jgi:hypothetical protein
VVSHGEFSCMSRHYQIFFRRRCRNLCLLSSFFCGGDGDRSVIPVKTTPELPSILTSEGKGTEYEKKLFTTFNIVISDDSSEYDRF